MGKWLNYTARAINIGAIVFISLFALDVFQAGEPILTILIGLFMHLIPSFVLIILLLVAWMRPSIGGAIILALSFVPFILLSNPFWVNLILCGPFALAGGLYLASAWLDRSSARP